MREVGLRHGRFGIFHRYDPLRDDVVIFSVASLVEPGTFDLSTIKTDRFPGVTLFLPLPAPCDNLAAFDDMLATARALAAKVQGQLLDEQGSRLSVQRERFLREEVIQFQHQRLAG
jgi:cell division protein ZipA